MWILVDTNVFLDFYFKRGQEGIEASEFFRNCLKQRHRLLISSMSLRDIEYTAHKYFHDSFKAKQAQIAAYQICSKVVGITADDAITSLYSDVSDYEDSLQLEAAKREMADLIITNNIKDFKNAKFPIWTPKEFNDIIKSEGV